MATTFTLEIAAGYAASTPHTIQVVQDGTLLGSATATVSTVGVAKFVSADVTLSGQVAGLVTASSYDSNGTLTNSEMYSIDAEGDVTGGGSSSAVVVAGEISTPIIIGDDYRDATGTAFVWTVDAISGLSPGSCSSVFRVWHPRKGEFAAAGTCSDNGDGTWELSHDVTGAAHTDDLIEGEYEWMVSVVDGSGNEITVRRNDGDYSKVQVIAKGNA